MNKTYNTDIYTTQNFGLFTKVDIVFKIHSFRQVQSLHARLWTHSLIHCQVSPYCSCDLHLIFPCSRRVCFCVGFKWKRRIASCYSLVAIRGVAVSTQSLREPADGSLVKQSESSTQSFAHWEVIGCSLALVCLCLLIVVPPLDSIGAVSVFAHLLHTIRFWNYSDTIIDIMCWIAQKIIILTSAPN